MPRTNATMGLYMDKESFKIDARIEAAIADPGLLNAIALLSERLAVGGALATVRLGSDRDTVLMAAIASALVAEPDLQTLVVAPSEHEVAGLKAAFDPLGRAIGKSGVTIGREGASIQAPVIIGSLDTIASFVASGRLENRSFGLVALSNMDTMANAATAAMLRHALGSSSMQRRLVAFCTDLGPSHRAIARDIGGALVEMELEVEGERAKSATCLTYTLSADDKSRLLLGLLRSEKSRPVAVFCDLRETAESTARMLRARGIRTEFILGNLPRKHAILEAVIGGEYELLVLTDEGARGLSRAWAAMIVNWDLPLEADHYLARLENLDTGIDDASIHNFACERYAYGIPAIERALGHRLKTIKAEESMMVAGVSIQEPRPRAEMDSRGAAGAESVSNRGSSRRRGDDNRDTGGQYDGRNARAIQADIAAITGGKPLRDASFNEPAKKTQETVSKSKKRGRKTRDNGATANSATVSRPASPEPGKRGLDQPRRRDDKQTPRQQARRPKGGTGQRLADPYSVSMEERLSLYRERYGEGASKPAQGGKAHGAKSQGGNAQGRKPPARRDGPASQARHGDKVAGSRPVSRPSPLMDKGADKPQSKGLLGSLRNLFGKKEE
ncbi:MAG: helicase-related protein [Spirochaetia bacterium]|nr:helicase-related protein [Spirochaetia bacterium]